MILLDLAVGAMGVLPVRPFVRLPIVASPIYCPTLLLGACYVVRGYDEVPKLCMSAICALISACASAPYPGNASSSQVMT